MSEISDLIKAQRGSGVVMTPHGEFSQQFVNSVAAALDLAKAEQERDERGRFASGGGGSDSGGDSRSAAGWKRDEEDPVSVPTPPVGAKVRTAGGGMQGTVKEVRGNIVSVAHQVTLGGKSYNRLDDFHASKLWPAKG